MKNILTKVSAVLLIVWYSMSIIGFDVHTCRETGNSFVHFSFTSHSCDDIHHSDRDEGTHHHDEGCCEDEYQVISLTGLRSDDDTDSEDRPDLIASQCPLALLSGDVIIYADSNKENVLNVSDKELIVPDVQAFYSVWRI